MRLCTMPVIAVAALTVACGKEKPASPPGWSGSAARRRAGSGRRWAASGRVHRHRVRLRRTVRDPAGPTRFTLTNQGKEPHHLVVIRIEGGHSYDSLLAALRKAEMPPRWAHPIGGPNGASPGIEAEAGLTLTPGTYAIACLVPGSDGVPHLAKGMIRPLTVTPSERQTSEAPADVVMNLTDYDFGLSAPLTAGKKVIRVSNDAGQLHEVVVARLESGKTMKEMFAWEMSGRKGPPPGRYVGGMSPLAPGDKGDFSMTFEPGQLRAHLLRARRQGRQAPRDAWHAEDAHGELSGASGGGRSFAPAPRADILHRRQAPQFTAPSSAHAVRQLGSPPTMPAAPSPTSVSVLERATRLPFSAATVFAWHERPGALERLTPPWEHVRVVERSGGLGDGGGSCSRWARRWASAGWHATWTSSRTASSSTSRWRGRSHAGGTSTASSPTVPTPA